VAGLRAGLPGLALVPLATCLCGCFWFTSRAQGDRLVGRADALDARVKVLEKQLESDRLEYTELIQKAERDVVELEKVLERATGAAAEYAVDTHNMRESLGALEGGLAELREELRRAGQASEQREDAVRDRMEVIASKVGLDPPLDQTGIPREKTEHFEAATKAYEDAAYGKARSLFRAYIEQYPTDDRVDDAQLQVGRAYAKEGRHAQALTALNVIVDRYPSSDLMGETLYEMADSLYKMRSCNDAQTLLQAVIQRYKSDASLTKRAQGKLSEVRQARRRGCRPE
jgi:TolA-binding protein